MAVKTITIDLEAYALLSRRKHGGQSFSEVIKEHFGRPPTAADFREILRGVRVADDTLAVVQRQVATRRAHPARAARR